MPMRSDYLLPEEIFFKIFLLLPIISILRCKSVCKSWLSIITDPKFIQMHLNISNTKPPSVLNNVALISSKTVMKTYNNQNEEQSLVSVQSGEHASSLLLPPIHKETSTRFIGYCNGLVCLSDYFNECTCVWNPSIKRFKILPTPSIKTNIRPIRLGFGYDSLSDDYKFMRIISSKDTDVFEAELYSVNADCWKEIELPGVVQNIWPAIHKISFHAFDGVLYLLGLDVLVSFDLRNEVFKIFPYPDSVKDKQNSAFLDFEGSVAMIFETVVGDGSVYSLWTFDYNVNGELCWNKKFNLETDLEIVRVHLYMGGGQFLAVDHGVGYFLYDLRKKETTQLRFEVYNVIKLSVVKYTESLVSLPGFKQVE